MVVNCFIEFDNNPAGIFIAGQMLTGRVTLQANQVKRVTAVMLDMLGYGETSWSETINNTTYFYRGYEKYLNSTTALLHGQEDIEIGTGIHTFTFSSILPITCPSSFESYTYGHIRYLIKVSLKRSWKFDITFTRAFTVIKYLNISYVDPALHSEFHREEQRFFCCGPCKSDPLTLAMHLPSTAFLPGQSIPIQVMVHNDTKVQVEETYLELILDVVYHADFTFNTRRDCKVLSMFKGEPVLRYTKKVFNYNLLIPSTPPSDITHSKYIKLSYTVKLMAKVKGFHFKKYIIAPITIGSVMSVQGMVSEQPRAQLNVERNLMNAASSKGSDENHIQPNSDLPSQNAYWNEDEPPTFEEAIYMPCANLNDQNDFGEKIFKPKYPVYRNSTMPIVPTLPIIPTAPNEEAPAPEKTTWL